MSWFSILREHLDDPEYLHVLINPLPVYGLAFGTLALALALFLRNHRVTIAALVLVFLGAISAWPTYHYGEAAYDRVKSMSDPAGERWLDEHMARGEKLVWIFFALAGLSAAGIVVTVKWPRTSTVISVITLVLSSGTLGVGGYISYAGGHVRHREFRFESPPPARIAEHHHGEEQDGAEAHEHAAEQKPAASAQPQMEHAGHESASGGQPKPEEAKSEQERKQLDASRLQLEASRKQLEASQKQLEAAGGISSASPGESPGASPSPKSSPEHKHDEHHHEQPNP